MKKILISCIGIVFALFTSGAHAAGNGCAKNGITLGNGGSKPVDCFRVAKLDYAHTCFAYCRNGKMIFGVQKCQDGYFALEPYTEQPELFTYCGTEKDACESPESLRSGARWNDDPVPGKCDCNGDEWNKTTMRCEESEDHKACQDAKDATWKDGQCVCNDFWQYQWDDKQHKCVKLPNQAQCEEYAKMSAAAQFEGKVKWNSLTRHCDCIADKNGKNITNPDDWQIGTFGCEKTEYALRRDGFAANKPGAEKASKKITKIVDELKNIADAWKQSHWKNADGEFNTARLASDSIAGVVLGTVGGVITSNVIKKNQVKGGFEDINCSIGGQHVADYGDQFRVGVH